MNSIKDYFLGHQNKKAKINNAIRWLYPQLSARLKQDFNIKLGYRAKIEHVEITKVFIEKYNIVIPNEDGEIVGQKKRMLHCFLYCRKLKSLPVHKPATKRTQKKVRHEFYDSDAWQKLRRKAIRKYGCKCMKCEIKNVEMHVDHIKPRSLYPDLELDFNNLQILCKGCNMEKSNLNEIDYRPTTIIKISIQQN